MKKIAVRGMIALAIVVALAMFFSGTIRTMTTPKVRFLTPRQGKFEQVTELTGKITYPEEEEIILAMPEGVTANLSRYTVQAGEKVKKGDSLFTAVIPDLNKTLDTLQNDYTTAQNTLRTQERKYGEIRLSRNEQAWKKAYEESAQAVTKQRDARVELYTLLSEEKLDLTAEGKLPKKASDELKSAYETWQEAEKAAEEAEKALRALDRYAIAEDVWNDITIREEQRKKMESLESEITELTVLSRMLQNYPAPHDGYISATLLDKGTAIGDETVVMKITPEKTEPVIRTDITNVKQNVAKGSAVEVVRDQWSTCSAKVSGTGITSGASKYADIPVTNDMLDVFGSLKNMMKEDLKLKMTTRAQESTCLIPATAVRGSDNDRYVFVAMNETSTFGGTQTKAQKTAVTVMNESATVVSVSEDLTYQQVIYQEDRPISDGNTVMAYSGSSGE